MGAPNDYYVHATEGSDATGDGSIGNPFATHIGALATLTQDSTNGDRINITGDVVATATIADSLGSYGTPTAKAPLIFNGLTDGGIDGDGTYSISGELTSFVNYTNLKLHNCGSQMIIQLKLASCINCEIYDGSYAGVYANSYGNVIGCNFYNVGSSAWDAQPLRLYVQSSAYYNYIKRGPTNNFAGNAGIYAQEYNNVVIGNIVDCTNGTGNIRGIQAPGDSAAVFNNTVIGNGSTSDGIMFYAINANQMVMNNIVEGFDGTGGVGIRLLTHEKTEAQAIIGHNAVYDCKTAYALGDDIILNIGENETLSASPFAKKGDNTFANRFEYFRPLNVGNILSGGYPVGSRMFKGAVPPKFAVSVPHMIQAGIGVL